MNGLTWICSLGAGFGWGQLADAKLSDKARAHHQHHYRDRRKTNLGREYRPNSVCITYNDRGLPATWTASLGSSMVISMALLGTEVVSLWPPHRAALSLRLPHRADSISIWPPTEIYLRDFLIKEELEGLAYFGTEWSSLCNSICSFSRILKVSKARGSSLPSGRHHHTQAGPSIVYFGCDCRAARSWCVCLSEEAFSLNILNGKFIMSLWETWGPWSNPSNISDLS